MKKLTSVLIALLITVACLACFPGCTTDYYKKYKKEIDTEMRGAFNFFWNEAALDESKPTYGLIVDRWPKNPAYASIASVGFGLTAYVIGVEEGWVTKDEAQTRSLKTLQTLLALQTNGTDVTYEGCFAHFISTSTGERYGRCEISTVDTAIMLCGALTAGQYFGGEVEQTANRIYANVNWKAYERKKGAKSYISMGYNPDSDKILSNWDWYAEQLMIYVLGAGSPAAEYRLDDKTYYDFTRETGRYGDGDSFIYSWFGSIFTYQFSHAWINFNGIVDRNGTDWFENSVNASIAAYEYCRNRKDKSKTFAEGGWGLTACDAPGGYNGNLGATPRGWQPDPSYYEIEGTVAPAGAIGSVVFTPKESLKALKYYQTIRHINGEYGLTDSYNLDKDFYATDCIGIDKGISLLMLANFKSDAVWEIFMGNDSVKLGLDNLGFRAK